MQSKQKKSVKKSRRPEDPVHLIYVRDIDKKDNAMLDALKVITGHSSNAKNIMIAGYKFLEQLDMIKKLKAENRKLQQNNEMKDRKYAEIKNGIRRLVEGQIESEARILKTRKAFIRDLKNAGNKIPKATSRAYTDTSRFQEEDDDDYGRY